MALGFFENIIGRISLTRRDASIPQEIDLETLDADLPPIKRKYLLMYLLVALGSLRKEGINAFAEQLYQDTLENNPRSLRENAEAAQLVATLPRGWQRFFQEDPFLNHTGFRFTKEEMERRFVDEPLKPNEPPRLLVDYLSGIGPTRPVLKRLYSLDALGLAIEEQAKDKEGRRITTFLPTYRARGFSETIRSVYDNRNWPPNLLMVVGPGGSRDFRYRPQRQA